MLLHNGNNYTLIPIGYSISFIEVYESVKIILQKLPYEVRQYVVNILLGQQAEQNKVSMFSLPLKQQSSR